MTKAFVAQSNTPSASFLSLIN